MSRLASASVLTVLLGATSACVTKPLAPITGDGLALAGKVGEPAAHVGFALAIDGVPRGGRACVTVKARQIRTSEDVLLESCASGAAAFALPPGPYAVSGVFLDLPSLSTGLREFEGGRMTLDLLRHTPVVQVATGGLVYLGTIEVKLREELRGNRATTTYAAAHRGGAPDATQWGALAGASTQTLWQGADGAKAWRRVGAEAE